MAERIPHTDWTDDEWLAVLKRFPPDADYHEAEEWVAEQREEANDEG